MVLPGQIETIKSDFRASPRRTSFFAEKRWTWVRVKENPLMSRWETDFVQ